MSGNWIPSKLGINSTTLSCSAADSEGDEVEYSAHADLLLFRVEVAVAVWAAVVLADLVYFCLACIKASKL